MSQYNISLREMGREEGTDYSLIELSLSFSEERSLRITILKDMFEKKEISILFLRNFIGPFPVSPLKVEVMHKDKISGWFFERYFEEVSVHTVKGSFIFPSDNLFSPDLTRPYVIRCESEKDAKKIIKPLKKGITRFLDGYLRGERVV
ncbi:hypothetical protein AV654_19775 [Paenibacillus elgii]|uniref:Uncharacterized protein n=1 Tax=Paenibacillus elgii TaxID=189691 RepID=A0A163XP98_9BACL|nr:hypothetical protein [Paenibacillus elgii]KZE78216.1 hypothetical protein AV654_19775 [Paenibacillus elgii]